jgi:hypothetical protein
MIAPLCARRRLRSPNDPAHLVPWSVAVGALASLALGLGIAAADPGLPGDVMPLADVKPGMKGYGLSVFSGTAPERFDVEVISTLRNFRPNQDLILIKTPNHPRLEAARTVAGMSGSPVYLNGKMIGAYAYGWLFGSEPIVGVTPIRSMLDELARPVPKALFPAGNGPLPAAGPEHTARAERSPRAFLGPTDGYDLARHAQQIAARAPAATMPDGTRLARATTPLLLGGVGDQALRLASSLLSPLGLDPLQAGGGAAKPDPSAPTGFVDGGAIGVQLVRGDISAMGLGTVTRVSGDRVLAFGHPMLNGGLESLPTAVARVHWILANANRSFKIGEAVRPLGALVNDRQAAIVVDTKATAPTFPMRIELEGAPGAPHPVWNVEVAHDQFLSPAFTAMALGSAFEATAGERGELTWRATHRLELARYGTVVLEDFGAGDGGPPSADDFARSRLVKAMGMLLSNAWEPVEVKRVTTSIRVSLLREVSSLRSAKVLEPQIDAGRPARVRVELEPFYGPVEARVVEVPIPAELAGREVEINLAPGYDVDRPRASPTSVAELVAALPGLTFDGESLVATVRLREGGAAYRGKVASRLPPGAMDTLRPGSDTDGPEAFAAEAPVVVPLHRFLVGRDTVRVTVRPVVR